MKLFRIAALLPLVVAIAFARPVSAQTFRGTVHDSTGMPLNDVRVTVLPAKSDTVLRETRSGNDGRFTLIIGRPGRYRLRLNRIGFAQQTSAVVNILNNEVMTLKFTLIATVQQLAPVTVVERRRVSLTELMSATGFDMRNDKYPMRALSPEELSWERRASVEDIFMNGAFFGSLQVGTNAFGRKILLMTRPGRDGCTPTVYFDGVTHPDLNIIATLGADQLYGIEAYRGNQVPPPSLGGEFRSGCGVVAVWSRNGRERDLVAARAKSDGPVQVVRGTVNDFSTGKPIANAEVQLRSEFGRELEKPIQTDSFGAFSVHTKQYESVRFVVKAAGYVQLTTPTFDVAVEEMVTVALTIATSHVPPAPIALSARELERNYVLTDVRGFSFRMRRDLAGKFFDSNAVARSGARVLSDLVRGIPNVSVTSGPSANAIAFTVEPPAPTKGDRNVLPQPKTMCAPIYFLNGELQRIPDVAIHALNLSQLHGVEAFPFASEVPFAYRVGGTGCGVIGVWKREN